MKKFLSKYWKRILILIATVFIAMNIINKCIAPHKLVEEYAKYGPDVESSSQNSGNNNDIPGSQIITQVQESDLLSNDIVRMIAIFGGGLLIAALLADVANKKSSSGKKK